MNDSLLTTGRPDRVFLFKLGIDVSVQAGVSVFALDDDVVFLDLRIARKCLPGEVGDLFIGRRLVRPARSQIVFDATHANCLTGIALGGLFRRQMADVTGQRDDAVIDLTLQIKAQHARIVFESVARRRAARRSGTVQEFPSATGRRWVSSSSQPADRS